MKKQKGKSRATHVAGDMRKQRLQSLLRVCAKMQAMKEEIRRQDRENGVYATVGSLALEPTIGMPE